MKKLNLLLLMLAGVLFFSCSKNELDERPKETEFKVDTLLAMQMANYAQLIGPELKEFSDSIAALHGGRACPVNLKTLGSIIRKCWTDSCQATDLKDLVRLTIACPFDSLKPMITDICNTLKKRDSYLRYKHQEKLKNAYWGDIINPLHYKLLVSEIQVKSFYMAYANFEGDLQALLGDSIINSIRTATGKEPSLDHHYYEITRDITGKYSEAEKEKAAKDSYDYLRSFWEKYEPGMTFYKE